MRGSTIGTYAVTDNEACRSSTGVFQDSETGHWVWGLQSLWVSGFGGCSVGACLFAGFGLLEKVTFGTSALVFGSCSKQQANENLRDCFANLLSPNPQARTEPNARNPNLSSTRHSHKSEFRCKAANVELSNLLMRKIQPSSPKFSLNSGPRTLSSNLEGRSRNLKSQRVGTRKHGKPDS